MPNSNNTSADLLVHPIGELVTPWINKPPAYGKQMAQVKRIKNAALAIKDGLVIASGEANDVLGQISINEKTKKIDAGNKLVTPGFIDPHTHLIFAGNRANEFTMRCQGKTYQEIAQAGGGIVASMSATRGSSVPQLVELGKSRLKNMLKAGTTTCEVKTGYGLSLASELNMLSAIIELNKTQPVELIPTFMPAHAYPTGVDQKAYVLEIVSQMLPQAKKLLENEDGLIPFFNDVFCDQGYFSLADTRTILEAGNKLGFKSKIHADEFVNLGATKLGIELGAFSVDHLLNVSDDEIKLLADSKTVAVLLPGTSFFLNLKDHAPARKMIEAGVAVALGSDFNPGSCHIYSLQFIWGLACLHLKMTTEEALTALTINAACATGVGDKVGQLMPSYQADFVVFDVSSLEEIPYNLGSNSVYQTYKHGRLVYGTN